MKIDGFFVKSTFFYEFQGKRDKFETKESQMVHLKKYEKENKSERRMPRLLKARKDVVSCEKLRGSANRN